ncbi:25615_t:CDS:2, partial [Gigaspora rosea]
RQHTNKTNGITLGLKKIFPILRIQQTNVHNSLSPSLNIGKDDISLSNPITFSNPSLVPQNLIENGQIVPFKSNELDDYILLDNSWSSLYTLDSFKSIGIGN